MKQGFFPLEMIVGIEISYLHTLSKKRGIGFYTENLIKGLKEYSNLKIIVIDNRNNFPRVDLIHYPFFDFFENTLPIRKKFPTIVTIHDCIPLKFPKYYPPGIKGKLNYFIQRISLKGVKAVITDSLTSKKDINQMLSIPNEKIFPIYLAQGANFRKISDKKKLNHIKSKLKLPNSFALFVGSVNWNKNILNMAKACIEAGVNLVLIGMDFKNRENLNHTELRDFNIFIERYKNHPKIHIVGFLEPEDLVLVYNLANVTLLVSRYEGFGLTILESQACGTPVITSNTSSMPEIAGSGAILVDPNNIDSINHTLTRIIGNKDLRNDLIDKGYKNKARFSWEKTAEETIKVYESVLKAY